MNRPYGAVDVSANLKGAVPKTATQKILLALSEKGALVQKTYGKIAHYRYWPLIISFFFAGKTSFFVYNQEKIESMPSDKLVELKKDLVSLEDENKLLANEVKTYTIGILHRKSFFNKIDAHIFVI
jgi:26S proteasome regulatory subunit, ATPase 3, interacting protein